MVCWEGSCCLEVGVQVFLSLSFKFALEHQLPSIYPVIIQHLVHGRYTNEMVRVLVFVALMFSRGVRWLAIFYLCYFNTEKYGVQYNCLVFFITNYHMERLQ